MLITKIDTFLDEFLDKFNIFLNKNKLINEIKNKENFVTIQNDIMNIIKSYIESIDSKELLNILKDKNHCENLYNVLKRYAAYYIYLFIGYHYKHGKENYITNIIDTSKEQHNSKYNIPRFFNSENNMKIIQYFMDIQNIKYLYKKFGDSIENINNFLKNNSINYKSVILFFDDLEEEFIVKNILIDNNIHNILKIIIFRFIYENEDKQNLLDSLNEEIVNDEDDVYIEIVREKDNKLMEITSLRQSLLDINSKIDVNDIYDLFRDYINKNSKTLKTRDYMKYLIENRILIPITEDILRYNKDDKIETTINERNDTRIKLILKYITTIQHYSFNEKDKSMKIKAEQIKYKPLQHRNAILYNDVEEIKTINKIKKSNSDDYERDIMKLEDIRKYNYINYKELSKDGFNIRLHKPVECIRYTNIQFKHSNKIIETRMASESIDINIVGFAWNPLKINLSNQSNSILVNIQDEFKNKNNYENIKKKINSKEHKIYYWLFDNSNDKVETDSYVSKNVTTVHYIYKLLEDFYKNAYIKNLFDEYKKNIDSLKSLSLWQFNNILLYYDNLINFNFDNITFNVKNDMIQYALTNKLIRNDMKNVLEPYNPLNKRKYNKLPTVNVIKEEKNIIEVKKEKDTKIIIEQDTLCIHYKKLLEINKLKEHRTQLTEFIEQYARTTDTNEFICKSCNDIIDLRNYIIQGTFNEEVDKFIITTDPLKKKKLTELDKYNKYPRSYKEINKSFERLVKYANIERFIGATSFKDLERKYIIKDIIDILLVTKDYKNLKTVERKDIIEKKYKINKNLTILFFFDLEDNIFELNKDSIDKYKIIKQNNVLIYLAFILITELNDDNIKKLFVTNTYNYIIFNKYKDVLFGKILIRKNEKEMSYILDKYPLLCYIIYYLSSLIVYKNIWLNNELKKLKVDDKSNLIYQRIAINSIIDLINFIVEHATGDNRRLELNSIYTKFLNKLETTYKNENTLQNIIDKSKRYYEKIDGKYKFVKAKEIDYISEEDRNKITQLKPVNAYSNKCIVESIALGEKKNNVKNGYNPIINCTKSLYHDYVNEDNDLICTKCNQKYSDIFKKFVNKNDNYNNYNEIIKEMQIAKLSNLMTKYCINGEYHEFDSDDSVCKKCNKETKECNFSNNDIVKFKKLFNIKLEKKYNNIINATKKLTNDIINNNKERDDLLSEFNEEYNKNTLKNITEAFISKLIDNIGNKTKSLVNKNMQFINETFYVINHNHLGYINKELRYISKEENLIRLEKNNEFFKQDVYVYTYKKISTYYNSYNLQYIGYKDKNEYVSKIADVHLIINYSIRDKLLKLGLSYDYYPIKEINERLYNKGINQDNINIVIKDLIRIRTNNLKKFINKLKSILYKISNKNLLKTDSYLIKQYNNIINDLITINYKTNKKILSNSLRIINNISISNIENNKYMNKEFINTTILKHFSNSDTKILFYIVHSLNQLLIYNQKNKNISDISKLIIDIIDTEYNENKVDINNNHYKFFNYIYVNNKEDSIIGSYKYELQTQEKTYDELIEEDKLDEEKREETTALDIDDYDSDEENDMYADDNLVENEIM